MNRLRRLFNQIAPFVLLAVLYGVAYANPSWRYDATSAREFTPLAEVVDLLAQSDSPIEATCLLWADQLRPCRNRALFGGVAGDQPHLPLPSERPQFGPNTGFGLWGAGRWGGGLCQKSGRGGRRTADLYFLSDRDVYAALLQLIAPSQKVAYFVTGHGEADISDFGDFGLSQARQQLQELGFVVEPLDLRVVGVCRLMRMWWRW
jgi:hypothetical protein